MPLPTPNAGEEQSEFVSRCMGDAHMNSKFPKQDQRAAVCHAQWKMKNKENELEKKIINVKALDVDVSTKRVKIAISQLENVDREKDVFDPSAYNKTIKENGPKGSNEIWHLLDHTQKSFSALSKFSELGRDGIYIAGVSNYRNSFAWREVAWPLYEAGDITQHSVGFETINATERDSKGIRIIKEVKLWEGSTVLWGAQPNTPTMAIVKSLMNIDEDRDITAAEKIEELLKKIKKERNGYDVEEDKSLLIIELKRLQTLFDAGQIKKILEPEQKTTPEIECPNCHKQTKNVEAGMGYLKCEHCAAIFDNDGKILTTEKATEPTPKITLPEVVQETLYMTDVVECPCCGKHTLNTQKIKDHIQCHLCKAVFTYGSKLFVHI